jgi:glucosamine 6-phosphate synthetase-like amidotransferase/phosphosugar isomerase protein
LDELLFIAAVTEDPAVLGVLGAAVAALGAAIYKIVDVFLKKRDAEDGWKATIGKIHTYVKEAQRRHDPVLIGDREVYSWKLSEELKRSMERTPELLQEILEQQERLLDEVRRQAETQEKFNELLRDLLQEVGIDA